MSNKHYTNYSKISAQESTASNPVDIPEVVEDEIEILVTGPTKVVEPEKDPEPEVTPPAPPVGGKVVGCERLNVRKLPDKNAEILGIVTEGSKVQIDLSKSTTNWYAVYTAAGLEGYCMKKYISTK